MLSWIPWLIAAVSTALCIFLWFRDVQRIMGDRKSTVESAARQFSACREKAAGSENSPECSAVLKRSESIYRQAVDHYCSTLYQPWIYLPAVAMGYRPIEIKEDGGDQA